MWKRGKEEDEKEKRKGEGGIQLLCAVEMVLNLFRSSISDSSIVSTDISPRSNCALASLVFWVFLASRGKIEA
jgi:hypothetical protein